jgi:hypothetical protein
MENAFADKSFCQLYKYKLIPASFLNYLLIPCSATVGRCIVGYVKTKKVSGKNKDMVAP